jgi:hypothetical protein
MPKLEAIPAVTSRPIKVKECLLFESAKIIIEFAINADAINTRIRFLNAALYSTGCILSACSSSLMPLHLRNNFIE